MHALIPVENHGRTPQLFVHFEGALRSDFRTELLVLVFWAFALLAPRRRTAKETMVNLVNAIAIVVALFLFDMRSADGILTRP